MDLDVYVKDRAAAIRTGKALLWDMQVGSDGVTACASCHYQAGADGRDKNQLAQGRDGRWDSGHALNQQLTTTTRFPFTKFASVNDPFSAKKWNYNEIVCSQGVLAMTYIAITNTAVDAGTVRPGEASSSGGINIRQVTGRNAPSVINAIFNDRNFWDGRPHNEFDGVNPFGNCDVNARVYENIDAVTGQATPLRIAIANASLASQAVGPVNSDVEMAHGGRDFAAVGKKFLALQPLGLQKVSTTDSILGSLANPTSNGLDTTFGPLISAALQPKWISGVNKFSVAAGRVVPDLAGGPLSNATTPVQGQELLLGLGFVYPAEFMPMTDAINSAYDIGYYNIGIRPTLDDLGIGGNDPFGVPLSYAKRIQLGILIDDNRLFDNFIYPDSRLAIEDAFKTPMLRNVALTGPYMHNGGYDTE